jgi:DNA primase
MKLLEFSQRAFLNPRKVSNTNGGEYHSACPSCGGKDRFYIQPNAQSNKCLGYYRCRQCNISGDTIEFLHTFLGYSFKDAFQESGSTINDTILRSTFKKPENCYASLERPPTKWINKANQLVDSFHTALLKNKNKLSYLNDRGISTDTITKYQIGFSYQNLFSSYEEWGLDRNEKKLWFPRGIVIPYIENGEVLRIKVRRDKWKNDDELPKYVAISGSMNGLILIGNRDSEIIVVVESELDAYALNSNLNEYALVVAVGSNIKNPDDLTNRIVKRSSKLLICYDNDDAGQKMLKKWQDIYPHAKGYPSPVGKDIGDGIKLGLNVKEWLFEGILNKKYDKEIFNQMYLLCEIMQKQYDADQVLNCLKDMQIKLQH